MNEACVRMLIRWSAKISAVLFSIAFSASSTHSLLKSSFTGGILKWRPHIGLLFGVSHTFHLLFLIWLQASFHPVFELAKTTSILGGSLAYLLMYAMMITTFPRFKTTLTSKQWQSLHLAGSYWIWLIFFRSYLRQVLNQDTGHLLLFILVMVFIFKMIRYFMMRNRSAV